MKWRWITAKITMNEKSAPRSKPEDWEKERQLITSKWICVRLRKVLRWNDATAARITPLADEKPYPDAYDWDLAWSSSGATPQPIRSTQNSVEHEEIHDWVTFCIASCRHQHTPRSKWHSKIHARGQRYHSTNSCRTCQANAYEKWLKFRTVTDWRRIANGCRPHKRNRRSESIYRWRYFRHCRGLARRLQYEINLAMM